MMWHDRSPQTRFLLGDMWFTQPEPQSDWRGPQPAGTVPIGPTIYYSPMTWGPYAMTVWERVGE